MPDQATAGESVDADTAFLARHGGDWDFVVDPETKTYGFRKAGTVTKSEEVVAAEVSDTDPIST